MAYHHLPTNIWDTTTLNPSFSFLQERNTTNNTINDPNMELIMNQCVVASLNYPTMLQNSDLSSYHQSITNSISYNSDLIIQQQQQQQAPEFQLLENSGQMDRNMGNYYGISNNSYKKRKAEDSGVAAECSTLTSSPSVSEMGNSRVNRSRKRTKKEKEEDKKSKEVVHVRARRGQATGSHSLAERVRREKINQKMRCLQDMVPGCYKAMGTATKLDEIINYVQCLQNQIEFLSMKLAAAALSAFHDLNSETYAMEKMEQTAQLYEAQQELDKFLNGGSCIDQQQAQALALFHMSSSHGPISIINNLTSV